MRFRLLLVFIFFFSILQSSVLSESNSNNSVDTNIHNIQFSSSDLNDLYKLGFYNEVNQYDLKIKSGFSETHRFWRTLGELIFLNSFGVLNYWINKHENMEDWEYKPDKEGFKKKIIDGWSLDCNAFRTNTIYHIYSGAIFHQVARSNEYSFIASAAWTFTGSLIWEYIGEFREQVSTNDMIFTTMGGALLGEAARLGSIYFEGVLEPGIIRYFLMTLFDPMRILNRAIDRCLYDDIDVSMTFINPVQNAICSSFGKNVDGAVVIVSHCFH